MDNSGNKWCNKGKHWLPRTAFYKDNRAKDGLQRWCRECFREHRLTENMPPEHAERRRARQRVENMTPEQVDRQRARQRVENMTAEQVGRRRARQRVENMTPEQVERKNARQRAHYAANPTEGARGQARFDTPAIRAVVLAALPKLDDGRPACPLCEIRPATRVEHAHLFEAAGGEIAPGELRGYVCASCNTEVSIYESRAHELSPEDPARDLALAGDVVAALRLTAEALENGTPCKPLVKRLNNKRTKGPFDCTAAGFWRAAAYIAYPPVRRLMDSGNPAIWTAIADALNAGGNTAKLAAIHCAEAGYRDCAEAYGIDVEAAIRHFASRAHAPSEAKRKYGQGENGG